ncbi:MAG: LysR substrate-binding domain-containing protein [Cyanobacteria bacterium J06623_5]
MEIYQLKVFLEVARHLSFTEAAEALNLTQPAVSAKIKSLEANLEADLFERLGRKIKLTTVGEYLLESGPTLLALESRLVREIEEIKQGKLNRLQIGCTASILNGWLPKFLFAYRQKYPDIDLQCVPFGSTQAIYQALADGTIEIGFSETVLDGFDAVVSESIDSFQYCLIVAADHRLANSQWLSLRNLTSETWVFPAAETPERLALETRLGELGLDLSDFSHHEVVQSPSLMSTFMSQGHYLGFASSFQFQAERRAKLLTAIPLQEFPLSLKLFMLRPKLAAKVSRQPKRKSSLKPVSRPVSQLVRLMRERTHHSREYKRSQHSRTTQKVSDFAVGKLSEKQFANSKPTSSPVSKSLVPDSPASDGPVYNGLAVGNQLGIQPIYLQSPNAFPSRPRTSETLTITIGTQNKTIQTVTAGIIIQKLGLLEHFLPREGRYVGVGYDIQWRDFTSGAPIVNDLQADRLDIGILGDYPLLLSGMAAGDVSTSEPNPIADRAVAAKTRLVSFVASNPDGAGNTVIVPHRSPLNNLVDLRSRVIAVPFASAAHGMIMRSLSRVNLLPEVTLTSIENLNIHSLTPRNPQADGYAYFAPLHDIASHKGQFRRLLEHGDVEQLPTFHGVVVREAFADEHADIVIAYLKALIAAQYWYESTPSALSLVSNWVGLAPEIVAKTLGYQRSGATGLFFPETRIRTDWIAEHIQQLRGIAGNEAIGDIHLDSWIQPQLLEAAISSM